MKKILYPGLVAEMARHGDTYKNMEELLGKSNASISKRFTGKKEWKISEINKICEYYNKTFEELFK